MSQSCSDPKARKYLINETIGFILIMGVQNYSRNDAVIFFTTILKHLMNLQPFADDELFKDIATALYENIIRNKLNDKCSKCFQCKYGNYNKNINNFINSTGAQNLRQELDRECINQFRKENIRDESNDINRKPNEKYSTKNRDEMKFFNIKNLHGQDSLISLKNLSSTKSFTTNSIVNLKTNIFNKTVRGTDTFQENMQKKSLLYNSKYPYKSNTMISETILSNDSEDEMKIRSISPLNIDKNCSHNENTFESIKNAKNINKPKYNFCISPIPPFSQGRYFDINNKREPLDSLLYESRKYVTNFMPTCSKRAIEQTSINNVTSSSTCKILSLNQYDNLIEKNFSIGSKFPLTRQQYSVTKYRPRRLKGKITAVTKNVIKSEISDGPRFNSNIISNPQAVKTKQLHNNLDYSHDASLSETSNSLLIKKMTREEVSKYIEKKLPSVTVTKNIQIKMTPTTQLVCDFKKKLSIKSDSPCISTTQNCL